MRVSRDETRVKVKDVNALEGVNVTRVRVEKVEKYGRKKGGTVVNAYTYSDPAISRCVTGANLVGWSRQASEVETSGNCGITGDKDGCATLVQSASKTSVCRYYSRHPLLDGGNKKKSVPRSHWVYASRIWRSNVSRSACRSGPFCRWSRAPLVSRDHTRYFFFPFFPPFQREKIYSYEYIEYGRAFCFVFSLRRLFALFFLLFLFNWSNYLIKFK